MVETALCASYARESLIGGHCLAATRTNLACTGIAGTFTLTGLPDVADLVVGMSAAGAGVQAGAVIASVDSVSQVTLSKAHTGSVTTATFAGDVIKMALIKGSPDRNYNGTQTNIGTPGSGTPSTSNLGTDEANGTGYVAGGVVLTSTGAGFPGNPAGIATVSYTPDPSWVGATFHAEGCIIYNAGRRVGSVGAPFANRTISVHSFSGLQNVNNGTFTVLMPVNDGTTAILRAG